MNRPDLHPVLQTAFTRTLLIFGGTAVILLLTVHGLGRHNLPMMMLPLVCLGGIALVNHPAAVCFLPIFFYGSSLTLPGLPSTIDLSRLFVLAFVAIAAARSLLTQRLPIERSPVQALVILYGLVIAVHMKARGFGLRIFGGEAWGGGQTVAQLLAIGFILFRGSLRMAPRLWLAAFVGACLLPAVPLFADLLFIFSGGAITAQYSVVQLAASALVTGSELQYGTGLWRLQRAAGWGTAVFHLGFTLFAMNRVRLKRLLVILLAGAALIGVSGHRLAVAHAVMFMLAFVMLRYPRRRAAAALAVLVAGAAIYAGLFFGARHLPAPYQRAVAFLPGVKVSAIAAEDAEGTSKWRVTLWKRAAVDWRRHFWIGKGLNISRGDIERATSLGLYPRWFYYRYDPFEKYILMHDYHNGPLGLLLDLGIFGLVIGTLTTLALIREGVRAQERRHWNDPVLRAIHLVVTARLITQVAIFFLIYGDVRTMVSFLFHGALMGGLAASDAMLGAAPAEAPGAAGVAPPAIPPV